VPYHRAEIIYFSPLCYFFIKANVIIKQKELLLLFITNIKNKTIYGQETN
jgi:hypothetical protein